MTQGRLPFAAAFVSLPTPFDARGAIDDAALAHLADYVASRSFEGVALLTEAAEDVLLTHEERQHIIDVVTRRLEGRKQTLVGLSTPNSAEAIDLARHAVSKGTSGFLVGPYAVPGLGYREIYRHIEKLGRAQDRPLYLVVRPENALDYLTPEETATLAKHPRISGAFVPGGAAEILQKWAKRFRDRESDVLSGCALTFQSDARNGATATVCAMALVAAEASAALLAAARKKDKKTMTALEAKTKVAVELLGPPPSLDELRGWKRIVARAAKRPLVRTAMRPVAPFALIKEALRLLGHPVQPHVRPPFEGVSKEEVEQLKAALKVAELMS